MNNLYRIQIIKNNDLSDDSFEIDDYNELQKLKWVENGEITIESIQDFTVNKSFYNPKTDKIYIITNFRIWQSIEDCIIDIICDEVKL